MTKQSSIRMCAASILAGLSLILTGCFITPGKFSSELVLSSDESFSFTYEGEIFFLGLSSLAQMGAAAEEFEPDECYDDETYETRECTEAELARQRADWDAGPKPALRKPNEKRNRCRRCSAASIRTIPRRPKSFVNSCSATKDGTG